MGELRVGIIMNGVTGRMGTRQHLDRSVAAIIKEGGITLGDGRILTVDPILVGRNPDKLRSLASKYGIDRWTTNLDEALNNPDDTIYFDAQTTDRRAEAIRAAIAAGKHIFCEKPTAVTLSEALELASLARQAGVKNGVVQDKLFLPGIMKLKRLIDGGFFGDLLSFRLNFGYWVFEGDWQKLNRPSWNYRKEDGGGLILDMYPHWRYLIDNTVSPIKSVLCHGAIHVPQRWDEAGTAYASTAEDAAYGLFELENGVVAQFTTSWATRPYRDEIGEWQLDGTHGSAIAGLRDCKAQARSNTPMPVWNPRHSQSDRLPRRVARGSRQPRVRQRVPHSVGDVPAPRRRRRTVQLGPAGGRQRGAAGRTGAPVVAGATLDRRSGAVTRDRTMNHAAATERLSINQISVRSLPFDRAVETLVRAGVGWIGAWTNSVESYGVARSAKLLSNSGLRVSSVCRAGFFTGKNPDGGGLDREANMRAVDLTAEIGAETLYLVAGGSPR